MSRYLKVLFFICVFTLIILNIKDAIFAEAIETVETVNELDGFTVIDNKEDVSAFMKLKMSENTEEVKIRYIGDDYAHAKSWFFDTTLSYKYLGELIYYNYDGCNVHFAVRKGYTEMTIVLKYKLTIKEMNYVLKQVRKIAGKINAKSEKEQVKQVNTYIRKLLTYKSQQNSIYKALKTKKGNCHSYAMLTCLVFDELGIENKTEFGYAGDSKHIWNKVRIDGKWYYVDITYNDTGDGKDDYLLISKTKLLKTHKIVGRN